MNRHHHHPFGLYILDASNLFQVISLKGGLLFITFSLGEKETTACKRYIDSIYSRECLCDEEDSQFYHNRSKEEVHSICSRYSIGNFFFVSYILPAFWSYRVFKHYDVQLSVLPILIYLLDKVILNLQNVKRNQIDIKIMFKGI